jgi:MFS family permease
VILSLGAGLMVAAGAVFALCGNYWVLLVAAVVGVISPKYACSKFQKGRTWRCVKLRSEHTANISSSENEIGPFRAIEESTLAQITSEEHRGDVYAWYSLLGAAGSAFGLGLCGWVLDFLLNGLGWNTIRAYRAVFWGYSALGVVMLCIVLCLSKGCEIEKGKTPSEELDTSSVATGITEDTTKDGKHWGLSKLPHFCSKSKRIVIKLCILFALDSFACSLAPLLVNNSAYS